MAVGSGVGVDVATAGEVAVGGAGMKGVGVKVASGSLVTSGLSCCKAPGNTAAELQDVRLKTKRSIKILLVRLFTVHSFRILDTFYVSLDDRPVRLVPATSTDRSGWLGRI